MNRELTKLVAEFDQREITDEDAGRMLDYASSVKARLKAAAEVDSQKRSAIKAIIGRLKTKYPNFEGYHHAAWGKSARDMGLTTNVLMQSMVLDETLYAEEKVIIWLRTILASFNMTPEHVRDAYAFLLEELESRVSREALELIRPVFERCVELIGAFPEPASPRV